MFFLLCSFILRLYGLVFVIYGIRETGFNNVANGKTPIYLVDSECYSNQ